MHAQQGIAGIVLLLIGVSLLLSYGSASSTELEGMWKPFEEAKQIGSTTFLLIGGLVLLGLGGWTAYKGFS